MARVAYACTNGEPYEERSRRSRMETGVESWKSLLTDTNRPSRSLALFEDAEAGLPPEEGPVDLIIVVPVGDLPGDKLLPVSGKGSVEWVMNQVLSENVFEESSWEEMDVQSPGSPGSEGPTRSMSCTSMWRNKQLTQDLNNLGAKEVYTSIKEDARTTKHLREGLVELLLRFLTSGHCGFQVRAFMSMDEDEVFFNLTAREIFLKAHAEMLNYKLKLSEETAIELLGGEFEPGEVLPPFVVYNAHQEGRWQDMHDGKTPFWLHTDRDRHGSIFSSVDRLRISSAVIERVFSLEDMEELGIVSRRFPCHSMMVLRPIVQDWKLLHPSVPIAKVNTYFGERTSFQLAFMQYLTKSILPLALVAPLLQFLVEERYTQMCIGLALILWAATFHEQWKREESYWQTAWGAETFTEKSQVRPRYRGEWALSPVDRCTSVKVPSAGRQLFFRTLTKVITVMFNAFVVATTLSLYAYRSQLVRDGYKDTWGRAINFAIAGLMQVFGQIWNRLVGHLVELDNYETETEYYESYVLRTFGFQMINSFCSLFYVAFVKHFVEGCGTEEECTEELANQLRVLFGIQIFCHLLYALIPYLTFRWNLHSEDQAVVAYNRGYEQLRQRASGCLRMWSYQEAQAKLPEYSRDEEITDRVYAIVELGHVLFFGLVAPEVIVLLCLSYFLHTRLLGWKLLHTLCRPFPHCAEGIGQNFHFIFSFICRVAVACNIVLVLLHNAEGAKVQDLFYFLKSNVSTPDSFVPRERDWKPMLVVFLLLERLVHFLRFLIDHYVPDTPAAVRIQQLRQTNVLDHWYRKMVQGPAGDELLAAFSKFPKRYRLVQVQNDDVEWQPLVRWKTLLHDKIHTWTAADPWFERVGFLDSYRLTEISRTPTGSREFLDAQALREVSV